MSAALMLLLAISAPGDAPLVRYTTKVMTKAWEPIELPEVERFLEAEVLQVLSAPGTMRLEKSGFADLQGGDYSLSINGRFIEEAERFSVYLTFGKGRRADLPSFHASHTSEALGRKQRSEMQRLISLAAASAAKRMVEVLAPRLEAARLRVDPPVLEDPELPTDWGTIDIPRVESKDTAIQTLLDVRNPDHGRHKALDEIQGHVFDQKPARNAVELCLLRDPLPALRIRCAGALQPVARNHAPTQRLILHAMRTDVDESVIAALTEVSKTFVGLSRMETIATWLHLVASEATPARGVERMVDLLQEEGDVPNLDFAVAACLQQEAIVYGKKTACAELVDNIPAPRRSAVVWKYLDTVNVWGQGEMNAYERVLSAALERSEQPPDPDLAELLIRIGERRTAGRARHKALYLAGRLAPATPGNLQRLIRLTWDQETAIDAFRAIEEMTGRAPDLTEMALGALARVEEKARYYPQPARQDPYEALRESIERQKRRLKSKR
jgi:hypothetical protein